jgi:hypothetical protein
MQSIVDALYIGGWGASLHQYQYPEDTAQVCILTHIGRGALRTQPTYICMPCSFAPLGEAGWCLYNTGKQLI